MSIFHFLNIFSAHILSCLHQNIKILEKDFNLFFNGNYYLAAISPKKWEQERNKYINNINQPLEPTLTSHYSPTSMQMDRY